MLWLNIPMCHDDAFKWKHFPRYWPFVRGIHRSPVNSPHKGQWRGALMFTLICGRINGWVNNCEAGDFTRNPAHYHVIIMCWCRQYWHNRDMKDKQCRDITWLYLFPKKVTHIRGKNWSLLLQQVNAVHLRNHKSNKSRVLFLWLCFGYISILPIF